MKSISVKKNQPSGFTLVEVAIVLVIVGLLMGGMLLPLSTRIEQQRQQETEKALAEIREALLGFAVTYGRLPCPANPNLNNTDPNAGMEVVDNPSSPTQCADITVGAVTSKEAGVLPWKTLGVTETDAWGRRFTYRVMADFADTNATTPTPIATCTPGSSTSSFNLCAQGNLSVRTSLSNGAENCTSGTANANCYPALVLSHGRNGIGAFGTNGQQMGALTDAGDNEKINILGNNDGNSATKASTSDSYAFVNATPTQAEDPAARFDDLLIWVPPTILFNRMVSAGKLP